jgi:hypothetical protein
MVVGESVVSIGARDRRAQKLTDVKYDPQLMAQ